MDEDEASLRDGLQQLLAGMGDSFVKAKSDFMTGKESKALKDANLENKEGSKQRKTEPVVKAVGTAPQKESTKAAVSILAKPGKKTPAGSGPKSVAAPPAVAPGPVAVNLAGASRPAQGKDSQPVRNKAPVAAAAKSTPPPGNVNAAPVKSTPPAGSGFPVKKQQSISSATQKHTTTPAAISGAAKPVSKPSAVPVPPAKKEHGKQQEHAKNSTAASAPAPSKPLPIAEIIASARPSGTCGAGASFWYEVLPPLTPAASTELLPPSTVAAYRAAAQSLWDAEQKAYDALRAEDRSADAKWMRTVLGAGGTGSDRLAALVLLTQESPLHATRHLGALVSLAAKKSRREAQAAIDALRDLFLHTLLPPDRRLVPFASRPLTAPGVRSQHLLWWLFEDSLRAAYAAFRSVLSAHLADALEHFKIAALRAIAELLSGAPEAEAELLAALVNKLGDPAGSIASKATSLLLGLLEKHPAMKGIVVREVQQFVYRPGLPRIGVYFGVLLLNQVSGEAEGACGALPSLRHSPRPSRPSSLTRCPLRRATAAWPWH